MSLPIWTIYDHPLDFPEFWVARKFELDKPTGEVILGNTLAAVRDTLPEGLICVPRAPADDPVIVECWL